MARKKPYCPVCQDKGDVDPNLKCGVCGEQLEYADEDGTLRVKEKERKCPRCETVNEKDVQFCEDCGAKIGRWCPYCKTYHFIEDKVCPKSGEALPATDKPKTAAKASNFLMAASVIAIIFFGFMIFRSANNGPPKPNVSVTPVKVPVTKLPPGSRPKIDVVFAVDATASMDDEIEVVKTKMREMVRKISAGNPKPYVRYGLVAYRDIGDAFVVNKYPLTDSMNEIMTHINGLEADGGGDTPEAVSQALHTAVNEENWDDSRNTKKMIFLIGDAGPHDDSVDQYDYRAVAKQAREKGIAVFAIGCSDITSDGEPEFREIAKITNGAFEYLTYQQAYRQRDGRVINVIEEGEKKYVVTGGDKDDWKGGSKALVRKKMAREVDAAAPAAPADAMPSGRLENNLDEVMTRQVQMEAEKMGVKY